MFALRGPIGLPDAQEPAVPQVIGAAAQLAESRLVLMQQRKVSSFMDNPSSPQGNPRGEPRRSKRRRTDTGEPSRLGRTFDAGEGSSGTGRNLELRQRGISALRESRALTPEARTQEQLNRFAVGAVTMKELEPQERQRAQRLLLAFYREVDLAGTTRIGQVLQTLEIRRQDLSASQEQGLHYWEIGRFQERLQDLDAGLKIGNVQDALEGYQALGNYVKESGEARQDLRQAWEDLHEAPLSPDLLIRRDLHKMSAPTPDGPSRLQQARTRMNIKLEEATRAAQEDHAEARERVERYGRFTERLEQLESQLQARQMDGAQQSYRDLKEQADDPGNQDLREEWQDLHGWSEARKALDNKGYDFHDPSPDVFPRQCYLEARSGAQPLRGWPSIWEKTAPPKDDLAELKAMCEEFVDRELKKRAVGAIEEALHQPWQSAQGKPADHQKVLEGVKQFLQTGVQPSSFPKLVVSWPELEKKVERIGIAVRREREETGQVTQRGGQQIIQYRDKPDTESPHVIMEPTGEWERITGKYYKNKRASGDSILDSSEFRKVLHAEKKSVVEKDAEEKKEIARWSQVKDIEVHLQLGQQIHLALDYRPDGGDQKTAEKSRMVLWLDRETNILHLTDQQGRLSTLLSENSILLTHISSGKPNVSQANRDRFRRYM